MGGKVIKSLALKQRYLEVTHKKPSNLCRSGKVDINKMEVPNDVTILQKVVFIRFLFFYTGLVIILWLTDMDIILWLTDMELRNLTKCYIGFAKVTYLICYSDQVNHLNTVNHLAFIEHTSIYTFVTLIYFLKTVQSFYIIFFTEIFGIT